MDREARKLAEQQRLPQSTAVTVNSPSFAVNKASPVKDDGYCQIQVRLLNGSIIKEKFKVNLALTW